MISNRKIPAVGKASYGRDFCYLYDYFLHISSATIIATFCVFESLYGRLLCVVVMISSPRTVAIFAIVAKVRLCVPLSQRLTSVSVLPRAFAKSRYFIFRSCNSSKTLLAIATHKSTCLFVSAGVDLRISSISLFVFILNPPYA